MAEETRVGAEGQARAGGRGLAVRAQRADGHAAREDRAVGAPTARGWQHQARGERVQDGCEIEAIRRRLTGHEVAGNAETQIFDLGPADAEVRRGLDPLAGPVVLDLDGAI